MLGFVLVIVVVSLQALAADPTEPMRSPLTSVSAVTSIDAPPDPDDPGIGGGFSGETYFSEALVPKLEECTDRIEAVVAAWTKSLGLVTVKKEKSPGGLLVHTSKSGSGGFFEFVYRVDAKRERARVTLYYYSNDGAQHEPLGIKSLLDTYGITDLQDKLQAALQCRRKKP
jgi:hypothetical protein